MRIKYSMVLLFTLVVTQVALAGKKDEEYKQYLKMDVCPIDSAANAFYINKDCEVKIYYEPNTSNDFFKTKLNIHFLIKIVNKESSFNTNEFFNFYFGIEKSTMVTKKKAQTIDLENGEVIYNKINNSDIFLDLYAENLYKLKIPFTNIKNGCLLEAEIEITTGLTSILPTWYFQEQIPVMSSKYETIIPEYFTFKNNLTGFIEPKKQEEFQTTFTNQIAYIENHTLIEYKDVPALVHENYAGNISNYAAKVECELNSINFPKQPVKNFGKSWQEIHKQLSESSYVGGQVNQLGGFLNDVAIDINNNYKTKEEKLKASYDYVMRNIKWNEYYSIGSDANGIRTVFKNKEGNAAEINLILIKLLNDLGINAYPAVMSTINNGFISYFPTTFGFNKTIAYVELDDKTYLLDASIKGTPFGILPEQCLNDRALVLNKPQLTWVDLRNTQPSVEVYNIVATLKENNIIDGDINVQYKNYATANFNKEVRSESNIQNYVKELEQKFDITIEENNIEPPTTTDTKSGFKLKFFNDNNITSNKTTYLNPLFFLDLDKNPFTAEKRNYPIIFNYPKQITYIINLKLDANQEVVELPKSENIKLPNNEASFMYQSSVINNSIQIVCKFYINKTLYEINDYNMLKTFFSQVIQKKNEQIAVKTK